ncbi:MAG: hypothetical protein JXQ90_02075 [Cyclobacteriaceae bacterium]
MKNWLVLIVLFVIGCASSQEAPNDTPFDHIADSKAKDILSRAMKQSGGLENWWAIDSMQYMKRSILYHPDSSKESDVLQKHFYRFNPRFTADISWRVDTTSHAIVFTENDVIKLLKDQPVVADKEKLRQSVMSALYVLAQPYKLIDAGTILTYKGQTTLRNGSTVNVIEARYNPADHENHSTQDLWWYYFNVKSGYFEGSMVYHAPTYALLENLSFDNSAPVLFHKKRKSYRSDSLGNIEYLRAEFDYYDYKVWQ